MIFVPKKNIYFPKYQFKSKFHQRGNFAAFPAGTVAVSAGDPGFPDFPVNGWTLFDASNDPSTSTVIFNILNDGSLSGSFQSINAPLTRWDGGGPPLNKANYQFRYDPIGDAPNNNSDVINAWVAANSGTDRWSQQQVQGGQRMCVGDIRIRLAVSPFTEYDDQQLRLEVEVE